MSATLPTITPQTLAALLSAEGTEAERLEAAYDLGVQHGLRHKTEAAKASAAKRQKAEDNAKAASAISNIVKCRSELERKWYNHLSKVFWRVEYEPRCFPCTVDGRRSSYTPDFRVTTKDGDSFYVEAKPHNWPHLSKKYRHHASSWRQARSIQAAVRTHQMTLFVVAGPPDEKYQTLQPLGFNITKADDKGTLIRIKDRVIALGKRPPPQSVAPVEPGDGYGVPLKESTRAELESLGFPVPPTT